MRNFKKNLKKVLVSFMVASTIFVSTVSVFADEVTVSMPNVIYQSTEKDLLSSGITHEKIRKFTTSGWWNLNVLRVDLDNPYTDIKGLISPNGIAKLEKTSSLVEKNNAIAGINGDFFDWTPIPWAISSLIHDGEMLSSPQHISFNSPSFLIDVLNQAKISYIDRKMSIKNLTNGTSIGVTMVNKATKEFDNITLYNKYFGSKSIGTKFHNDLMEVVVDNGIVVDIRLGKEAVNIPENGYILVVRGSKQQELSQLSIGDNVEFFVESNEDIENIRFAIGGGSYILKDGKLKKPELSLPGNAPRTGIGISQDGREIMLVTIDGRDSSFKGVTQEMFGAILRDLGAYNAINLDGGGSTTMAIKSKDTNKVSVVNKPSDNSERSVINGVGVFSNAPLGELSYIKLSTDDNNMFSNSRRKLTVKGYDEHHNLIDLDKALLAFSFEGVNGAIEGNMFKALAPGKATVTAYYGDLSSTISLNILGNVVDINTSTANFSIDINSERLLPSFQGKDSNGFEAKIYPEDIVFTPINDVGTVKDGIFYSSDKTITGALSAKYGEGIRNIIVNVGNDARLIEGFEALENFNFSSYPNVVLGGTSLSNDAKEGKYSLSLSYDFSQGDGTRAAYLHFLRGEGIGLPIEGVPKKLGLWIYGDESSSWLRGTINDSKGDSHTIDFAKTIDWAGWKFVTVDIPTNLSFPITLEKIYPVETDALKRQSGEILFDGLMAYYPPKASNIVLPTPSTFKDSKNVKSTIDKNSITFSVFANTKGSKEYTKSALAKILPMANKHKIAISLNGMSEELSKGLKTTYKFNPTTGYKSSKHGDLAFISLNTSKNGIRETSSAQWNHLQYDLNTRQESNIVLLLPTAVFGADGFTDTLEANLLHQYLTQVIEKGKNVFVIHGGASNSSLVKDGVRYIGINTKSNDDISKLSFVEFVLNGSNLTYSFN